MIASRIRDADAGRPAGMDYLAGLAFQLLQGFCEDARNTGAVEKTRTFTPVKEQRPQRCASTNSATAAHIGAGLIAEPCGLGNRQQAAGNRRGEDQADWTLDINP